MMIFGILGAVLLIALLIYFRGAQERKSTSETPVSALTRSDLDAVISMAVFKALFAFSMLTGLGWLAIFIMGTR